MLRMRRFFHRLLLAPNEVTPSASADESIAARKRITRVVTERLAEDESLRGGLTDDGYGPILDFAISLVPRAVNTALEHFGAQEAEDEVSHHARALVRGIVTAAEQADPDLLVDRLSAPFFEPTEAARAREMLSYGLKSGELSDVRAHHIAALLRASIREPHR